MQISLFEFVKNSGFFLFWNSKNFCLIAKLFQFFTLSVVIATSNGWHFQRLPYKPLQEGIGIICFGYSCMLVKSLKRERL